MRHILVSFLLLVMPWPAAEASAFQRQNRPEIRSGVLYRLNFTLHVFEGSQDRKREFVMTVGERRSGRVRALTKVPVRQGIGVVHMETGVKRAADRKSKAEYNLKLNWSSTKELRNRPARIRLLIHESRQLNVILQKTVPPNEATVLSTYNDKQRNRRYEFVVTAEKLQ